MTLSLRPSQAAANLARLGVGNLLTKMGCCCMSMFPEEGKDSIPSSSANDVRILVRIVDDQVCL